MLEVVADDSFDLAADELFEVAEDCFIGLIIHLLYINIDFKLLQYAFSQLLIIRMMT